METASNYDEIPYESQPFPLSHPDHLAVIATFLGIKPKAIGDCRVLELGCAAGNNLIPIAYQHPHSSCVGIDQSARQINQGLGLTKQLALTNIELHHLDLAETPASLGSFDYILCHGLFSWVPQHLQSKVLELCEKHLGPNGIAYISYNTYPGWHLRAAVREMLFFHTKPSSSAEQRILQARAAAKFYAKALRSQDAAQTAFFRSAMAAVEKLPDWYLFHDLLERDNYPVYFSNFVSQAQSAGLRYLTDADISSLLPQEFPADVQKELAQLSAEPAFVEQSLDFLRLRLFRQSVLCSSKTKAKQRFDVSQLPALSAACSLSPAQTAPGSGAQPAAKFFASDGTGLETADPLLQHALAALIDLYPKALPFAELAERVAEQLPRKSASPDPIQQQLAAALFRCYLGGFLKLSAFPPQVASAVSPRPVAYGLAREQAAAKAQVTNVWHELIDLDEFSRKVLQLLDGLRDIDELENHLTTMLSPEEARELAAQQAPLSKPLRQTIEHFRAAALLVA